MNLDSKTTWPEDSQRTFWNQWDGRYLQAGTIGKEALRRGQTAISLLEACALQRPHILELGCGNGWLAEELAKFGPVTGVDIADEAIAEARRRVPNGTFYAGDALRLELATAAFDVIVTLETFSHVPSQPAFVDLMARVLKRSGYLILTTQNRFTYARSRKVRPPGEGQLRRWVTMSELRGLLRGQFRVLKAFTIQPGGDRGILRIINSGKINRLLSKVIPGPSVDRLKEKCGLGQTLVVLAENR